MRATRGVAERAGVSADDLYERALRDVLARDFADLLADIAADQAATGVRITDDEGVALAYDELGAVRDERRNASWLSSRTCSPDRRSTGS